MMKYKQRRTAARGARRPPPMTADFAAMARHAAEAAELVKSLAHPARLLVMCRLVEGEATVSELRELTNLSMSALSQHLAVLRTSGLVATRRESQEIHYRLVESPALGVMDALHEAYCGPARRRTRS
jgi:DNA-binding transcriptional ArsR family regulator